MAEKLNKKYESTILITENTYNLVKEFVKIEEKTPLTSRDIEKTIKLFAVTGLSNEDKDEE